MKDYYKRKVGSNFAYSKLLALMLLPALMLVFGQFAFGQATFNPASPVNVGYTAGSVNITITTCNGNDWTATQLDGASWSQPASETGSSGGTLTVSFDENTSVENRNALYQISVTGCSPAFLSIIQAKEGVAPVIQSISSANPDGSYKHEEEILIDVYYFDANSISLTGDNLSTDFYLNLNNGAFAYYDSH